MSAVSLTLSMSAASKAASKACQQQVKHVSSQLKACQQ
jgi:hypothetical protein